MKILYVVSRPININTSSSIRNRATIDGLIKLGHQVHLITTETDMSHTNYDDGLNNGNITVTSIKIGGIQSIARVGRKFRSLKSIKTLIYRIISKFEIYDNLKGFVNYALDCGLNDNEYDLIISSSDPKSSHLFVSVLFEKCVLKYTPWIQIWGDPFFSDITRRNYFLNSKIAKEERRLLHYASKIVYVSGLTLNAQKKLYPQYASRMFYEPIPYLDKKIYQNIDVRKSKLSFLYCGDYASNVRNIKELYEAIKWTDHKLVICGNSDLKLEESDQISIYPRVTFEKIKELEEECDVLVHLSNLKGTQIPGKIYQYCGTNKPILFILDGSTELLKSTFEHYDRFVFVNNDKEDICRALSNFEKETSELKLEPLEDFEAIKVASDIIKYDTN